MKFVLKAYDRSKLVKKVIVDKHGRRTTRWVKPDRIKKSRIISRRLPTIKNVDKYKSIYDVFDDDEDAGERLHDFIEERMFGSQYLENSVDDEIDYEIDNEIDKIDAKINHLKYKYKDIRVLSFPNHIRGEGKSGIIVGEDSEKNIIKNHSVLEPPKLATKSDFNFLDKYASISDTFNSFIRLDDADKKFAEKIGWSKEKLKAGVNSLKSLMNKTKSPIKLYRLISNDKSIISDYDTDPKYEKKKEDFFNQITNHKVGDSFDDNSFVSTSSLSPKDIYTTYIEGKEFGTKHNNGDNVAFMELEVDSGVDYIDFIQSSNNTSLIHECEVLLGGGLKLELTKIRKERIFETDYQVNTYKVTKNK